MFLSYGGLVYGQPCDQRLIKKKTEELLCKLRKQQGSERKLNRNAGTEIIWDTLLDTTTITM
jgi:hypothetical protein